MSDADECKLGKFTCGTNEQCSNTVGSYGCVCSPGYARTGLACVGKLVSDYVRLLLTCNCFTSQGDFCHKGLFPQLAGKARSYIWEEHLLCASEFKCEMNCPVCK